MQHLQSCGLASNPDYSVWVCANAGSGKTTSLTNRVIRLLLDDISPKKILCLTYTRAAAAEMLERVYHQVSQFVILDDLGLEAVLKKLTYRNDVSHLKAKARVLFFDLIDRNNSLKIQTLHSFCQNLLSKFPIEAGVELNFKLVEDVTPLVREAKFRVLSSTETLIADSIKYFSLNVSNFSLDKLIVEIVQHRSRFASAPSFQKDKNLKSDIKRFLDGFDNRLLERLQEGSDADIEKYFILKSPDLKFFHCKKCFLTQKGEPLKKLVSANLSKICPEFVEWMTAKQQEYVELLERYKFDKIATASKYLFIFAHQILLEYSTLKQASSLLDYQDIIEMTLSLLNNQEMSEWIKYKLDYRIEHLLVDEAQDTSSQQWQIINNLLAEFYAGAGAVEVERTLFVVGDDKQSIFSFQGANPELFAHMESFYKGHFTSVDKKFVNVSLERSFRSAREILEFVDRVFNQEHLLRSITKIASKIEHEVVKDDIKGVVEIWPLASGEMELAQKILLRVKTLLKQYSPRDIMILVRRRSGFLEYLSSLLKQELIPIVTPERLLITEHSVAKYLLNIAKFILLPQDDLNLACLLKSPIFEVEEEALFELRTSSHKSLWQQLADHRTELYQQLQLLLEAKSKKNVAEFYFYIIDTLKFRERFFAYFAEEAGVICDQFLDMVLTYQSWHVDSLQSFVFWFENSFVENSHHQEDSDKLRIMTVHGAKGLQAPIVILADTTKIPKASEKLLWNDSGECLLVDKQSDHAEYTRKLHQLSVANGLEEYYRLLYVALTRAEKNLIICGYGNKAEVGSWYDEICSICPELVVDEELPINFEFQAQQRNIQQKLLIKRNHLQYNEKINLLPFNITSLASQDCMSSVGKTMARGLEIGELTHLLLDILPKTAKIFNNKLINFLAAKYQTMLLPEEFELAVSMAKAVLQDEELKFLFAHNFYSEIAVSGVVKVRSEFYHNLYGRIDLLVFLEDRILIVDYKSNLEVPNGPQQIQVEYLKQLGLYRKIIADLYPNINVVCYLLWCAKTTQLMEVPRDLLREFTT